MERSEQLSFLLDPETKFFSPSAFVELLLGSAKDLPVSREDFVEGRLFTFRFVFKRFTEGEGDHVNFTHVTGSLADLAQTYFRLLSDRNIKSILLEYLGEFDPSFCGVVFPVLPEDLSSDEASKKSE